MAPRRSADPESPLAARGPPAVALRGLLTMTGASLALVVGSTVWLVALLGAFVIGVALLVALARAIRRAMRPQHGRIPAVVATVVRAGNVSIADDGWLVLASRRA
jgi:hypothetical protein